MNAIRQRIRNAGRDVWSRRNTDVTWKMKRAFALIEPKVKDYLDHFSKDSLKEINFSFKGNQYKSLADVIFVVK